MKLKVKLISVISIIIVILSAILTVISYVINYNSSISLINDFIPKVVNSTSEAIENKIGNYIFTMKTFSKNSAFASLELTLH